MKTDFKGKTKVAASGLPFQGFLFSLVLVL